ncbi:transcriptional regulator [Thiohalobacter thiocyanaticus]|uniref:Transcriptional regulator n=1 Tax=Thiohalobacter thiocyanaticus TaxID=585455 RepID=A0A1Z4VLS1_9GAMM|nr:TetR family transcriptional regulator [Thiohalobacter thiocyanaticus]BAZ92549.1 transcriptional regulator [Thiohalobacter thiocyanaticus]
MATNDIPLRERKAARTRLNLARALAGQLARHSLDEVAVRDLCAEIEISEATFFNYFPRKTDLLAYLGRLWTLELQWHASQAAAEKPGLAAIEAVFQAAARRVQAEPQAWGEWIAWQAQQREKREEEPLTQAEKRLGFPDCAGIETLAEQRLDGLLAQQLTRAIERGELPANTPVPVVMAALIAQFYGVILILKQAQPGAIGGQFRQQLQLLWAGIRELTRSGTNA